MINSTKIAIIEAICLFEQRAEFLINLLAKKFDLDLDDKNPFGMLILRTNNLWNGDLNNDWKYHFHGDACKFENKLNGQIVDVKINRMGHYGIISDFYLFKFIETTNELTELYETIGNESTLIKLIDELEKDKFLINLDKPPFITRILNRDTLKKPLIKINIL